MICPVCKEDVIEVRTKMVDGEMAKGCADCYPKEVRRFRQRSYRQPKAWFTNEKGQEYGVDKQGVIPPHEDPYHGDEHGWEFTGKKNKKMKSYMFK